MKKAPAGRRYENMGHTFSNLLIHIVFSVKKRRNYLHKDVRKALYAYIYGIAKNEESQIIEIGGIENHVHILLRIKPSTTISDIIRKIKSNSSKWLKENYEGLYGFSWQAGFSCFSVSESGKASGIKYIKSQEKHHQKIPFEEELKSFLKKHGIQFDREHYLD